MMNRRVSKRVTNDCPEVKDECVESKKVDGDLEAKDCSKVKGDVKDVTSFLENAWKMSGANCEKFMVFVENRCAGELGTAKSGMRITQRELGAFLDTKMCKRG